MSARLGASARRSQAAVLRQNPVVRGLDCVEGLLRRKRIKPQSQQIYQAAVDEFHLAYRLSSNSSAAEIDTTLDAELVRLYLSGESPGKGKVLYYAVRWHHCLPNAALPRAFASRQGHSKVQRSQLEEPEPWQTVVLAALALLSDPSKKATPAERVWVASAMLIGFDVYARGGDMMNLRRCELLPPSPVTTSWSLTMWPSTETEVSKVGSQDDTKYLGATNADRAWLAQLCRPLLSMSRRSPYLFPITQRRYLRLFHLAHSLANVPASHPHRLRHGGASADALAQCSDLCLMERGPWRSVQSIMRYRRPARYLRQLALLTPRQVSLAADAPTTIISLVRHLASA